MKESEHNLEAFLFEAAAQKTNADERAAFLDGVCRDNPSLRARLDLLLEGHFAGAGFLAPPEAPTVPAPPPEVSSIHQMIGRYKLLEKVGEGGFGEVWMADQREPVKRRVAIKIIKLGMDSRQVVARFEAERQALALMDHPNIAKVFDAGATDAGRPYFVMELVRGIKITEYCDQNQLPTPERLKLFTQVCHAIQHAHQKGIIHRDIKPSNILVTLHDGAPVPKVIDFGIAKATQQELTDKTVFTQFQQFIGTPAYISPEQAEMSGLDIDTRADIYSLGVLLYELLVGQTPFDAKEMMKGGIDALRQIIREKEPLRPSTKLNTLPGEARTTAGKRRQTDVGKLVHQLQGDLDWIVMKCLEKDRTRRYETANGLASDIQRHLANEPVAARPPSAAYKLQKAWKRNKLVFGAATAVAVALVVGLGLAAIGWRQTSLQRDKALKAQRETELARNGEQQQRLEAQSAQKLADTQARKAAESEQRSRRLLYASDMNLAQQSLKLNNLGRARLLLDRHRPQPGDDDLRGWEWRYLWQLTRSSALVTLTNRSMRGWSISFSPDGNHLAAGWHDGCVDLWDVPSRRRIRTLREGENLLRARVAFSPVRNLLAATSWPTAVALHDLDSGAESILWRAPESQGEWDVRDLAFSQDGSRLIIYAGSTVGTDTVWVMNVSSSQIESHHATIHSDNGFFGAARLSPDNRRLYLTSSVIVNQRQSIRCLDLVTGKELWQTKPTRDQGISTLAVSPDGRVIASATAFEDPAIRVWDATTGQFIVRLDGHTGWVGELAFTADGRRLISAASDQSIRFWNTTNWTETHVLRGHIDEVHAVAISEPAQLIASISKDGDLMLWKDDGRSATDGYSSLPEELGISQVLSLDQSRVLLLPQDKLPELVDLKRNSPSLSLLETGSSTNVLGCFDTNILCHWDGTNQIVVRELRGREFIRRGAIALDSGTRPSGFAYNHARQLLAWTEGTSSTSIYLTSLTAPGRRIELKSEAPGRFHLRFSPDGNHLAAWIRGKSALRRKGVYLQVWHVESGQIVASIDQSLSELAFAAGGRVLAVVIKKDPDHEIGFYDLVRPNQPSRRVPGKLFVPALAVSPDGGLVAASTWGGLVRLFDPVSGELIDDLHGHLNSALGVAFSADGRRLLSAYGAREAVKLWDVDTRQELLTLTGIGTTLNAARWSADGDVILAGTPWQTWRAPSWAEIAAVEAKEKTETGAGVVPK